MTERRFERLVRDHRRAVTAYARATAASATIAEDAVQETFLKAWRYFDSFRGDGSAEGWLIRICRRCIIDLAERESRAVTALSGPVAIAPDYQSETMLVIATLNQKHREVLALCGLLGYDYETASQVLDIPVGTVRSRLHRARALLAAALDPATESAS